MSINQKSFLSNLRIDKRDDFFCVLLEKKVNSRGDLLNDEKEILRTKELAFCFDKLTGTLHKYGSPEFVEHWTKEARTRFVEAGWLDSAGCLHDRSVPQGLHQL